MSIDLFHAALVWFRNTFELSTTTGLDDCKLGRTTFSAGALQKHIFNLCQIWLTTGASGHVTDISISGSTDGVAISHTLSMLISFVGSAVVTGADFIPLGRCDFACGSLRGDRVIWLRFYQNKNKKSLFQRLTTKWLCGGLASWSRISFSIPDSTPCVGSVCRLTALKFFSGVHLFSTLARN